MTPRLASIAAVWIAAAAVAGNTPAYVVPSCHNSPAVPSCHTTPTPAPAPTPAPEPATTASQYGPACFSQPTATATVIRYWQPATYIGLRRHIHRTPTIGFAAQPILVPNCTTPRRQVFTRHLQSQTKAKPHRPRRTFRICQ